MLLAKDSMKVVNTKLIRIVNILSFFKSYPWEKEIFQLTIDYLNKKSDLKKQSEVFDEKQKASFALFGFPWAFMVKNNILNGLKKDLQGVTILTSNGDSDDDGNLGGKPIGIKKRKLRKKKNLKKKATIDEEEGEKEEAEKIEAADEKEEAEKETVGENEEEIDKEATTNVEKAKDGKEEATDKEAGEDKKDEQKEEKGADKKDVVMDIVDFINDNIFDDD
ncbi:DDRGK domain-containing protein 1-like [Capsicum annuum]|uniref:DDRGK domain-containing protein 1-like n=1 Tax=Capsicum annuum TaxID=4072 RepID=UPI001FB1082D|nr:DDRGK domain-containing protein 1-like [Capsicum annuum]